MPPRVLVSYDIQVFDPAWTTPLKGQYSVALATGNVRPFRHVVGATTTLDLWISTASNPATFEFFFIVATGDILIELTTDTNAGVGTELYTIQVDAEAPFILSSDTSYANYTANFGGGTLDVIDRIRVRNAGASPVTISGIIAV